MSAFGRYEILERLGAGGMAEVFRARAYGADGFVKDLVVKKILPSHSADEGFRKMFVEEAKITVGLTHSNIVQVFDFGKLDETYFLAMEQVHGVDLRRVLQAAAAHGLGMPVPVALYVVGEVLKGLDYAHRRLGTGGGSLGLVHRDVSPANVLCSFEGEVKVADFGIARAADRGPLFEGQVVGKPRYMSPEQIEGRDLDPRSDIFSCGVVLFELLTGQQPFTSSEEMDTFAAVLTGTRTRMETAGARLPRELDPVVLKALAVDREKRFQSAAEMGDAIHDYALDHRLRLTAGPLADFLRVCGIAPEQPVSLPPTPASREVTVLKRVATGDLAQFTENLGASSVSEGASMASPRRSVPKSRGSRLLGVALGAAGLSGAGILGLTQPWKPAAIGSPTALALASPSLPPVPTAVASPSPAATPTPIRRARSAPVEPGLLYVMSDPYGEVWVDGKKLEHTTPIQGLPLSPGRHHVHVESPVTRQKYDGWVEIETGKPTRLVGLHLK